MTARDKTMSRTLLRCSGRVAGFLGSARAGAGGLSSVLIALMCLTGTAFVSDHALLVHYRNTLEAGTDAAGVAATRQMAGLDEDLTQAQLVEALEPLVKRYVLANVPEGTRDLARDTLEITVTPDREAGVVGVEARADLGGAIAGRFLWGRVIDKTIASSGVERIVAPVDLVLAIDVTGSMGGSIIFRENDPPEERKRINVVRKAAQILIEALYDQEGETGHVSVGLVPFNTTVNIGKDRQDWVSDLGQGHKVIPAGFGPWQGCVESRVQTNDLDLSLVTPADQKFTSWFAPSTYDYNPTDRAALAAETTSGRVYGDNDWSVNNANARRYHPSPHFGCPRDEVVPLTNDREKIDAAIAKLAPWGGGGTMTHFGVVWGRRLLASGWRESWGLPADREELDRKRVLVVLTDGWNAAIDAAHTYPGNYRRDGVRRMEEDYYNSHYTGFGRAGSGRVEDGHRANTRLSSTTTKDEESRVLNDLFTRSCELAKGDGITVFTVSAVPQGHNQAQALGTMLTGCATSPDHAFVRNSDTERMKAAFRKIGRMVQGIRRTGVALGIRSNGSGTD